MSSNIPWARKVLRLQLEELSKALGPSVTGPEREKAIRDAIMLGENALAYMTRESFKPRRAKVESDALTPELAEEIRRHLEENPGASVKHVAALFHVNQGRVTEALQGKV
jgi:hypothetical protein